VFLSGGQSEEEATLELDAMNKHKGKAHPWALSFSYGRALQSSCIKKWAGKEENFQAAQETFIGRAKANSEASMGKYKPSEGSETASHESLFVKDYKY